MIATPPPSPAGWSWLCPCGWSSRRGTLAAAEQQRDGHLRWHATHQTIPATA